jgi:glutathione S-transferase
MFGATFARDSARGRQNATGPKPQLIKGGAVMPGIELVWFPGSCSRVTLIALEEIGVPFTDTVVPRAWANNADYLALNPKGKVPTLVIDGVPFTETMAIVTHLADSYPEARLLPVGNALVDIDVLATMSWFASGLHPLVSRLRFPMFVNDDPSSFDRTRAMAAHGLARCFAILEERLSDREWLYGDWSIVDGYLLWFWFRAVGSGMDGAHLPRCADHAQRCEQRPSVTRALEREETAYASLLASGALRETLPPHQVGRAPAAIVTPDPDEKAAARPTPAGTAQQG